MDSFVHSIVFELYLDSIEKLIFRLIYSPAKVDRI